MCIMCMCTYIYIYIYICIKHNARRDVHRQPPENDAGNAIHHYLSL